MPKPPNSIKCGKSGFNAENQAKEQLPRLRKIFGAPMISVEPLLRC
jgi:hypothetical protein